MRAHERFPTTWSAGLLTALALGVANASPVAGAGFVDVEAPISSPGRAPPRVVPERWTLPDEVLAAVRAVADRPLGERIAAASEPFLGLPYLHDAAGEGEGTDADPPARYDAFDCLTFVEEVLGAAMAGDPLYAPTIRDALRYRGGRTYEERRHFMEAEWIPEAVAAGLLEDVTARLGSARTLRKTVTPEVWGAWRRRALFRLPDARLPVGTWTLDYLDLAEGLAAVDRIPPGALVVTLRRERAWVPVVVTHVGLVVEGPGEPLLRHATRMGTRKVRDDRLRWYVEHLRDYANWPALGVAVLLPREQGPRRSALAAPDVPPVELPRARLLADDGSARYR